MRYLEYGQIASQWAKFSGRIINGVSALLDTDCGRTSDYAGTPETPTTHVELTNTFAAGVDRLLFRVELDVLRSQLGHAPVLLYGELAVYSYPYAYTATKTVKLWTAKLTPDYTDATARYRDATGPVTWYEDHYAPVPGQDISASHFLSASFNVALTNPPASPDHTFPLTDQLADALRRTRDLQLVFRPDFECPDRYFAFYWNTAAGTRPHLRVFYLYPVEFFHATGNLIDLTRMVDNSSAENPIDLGALERGETGTAVKVYLKNFGTRDLDLVEVLDDHPEWSTPVQSSGTGTGTLDYVALADTATSQLYTVTFTSATEFWVKAESYRDNTTSYHPTDDSDPDWEGSTDTDFVAPEGGLTIPATAWQPGTLTDDVFVCYVRGNSTDTTWPSDSAEQMEMTADDAGTADAARWRPIRGRRTVTTAAVTIDATTKRFPVAAIDAGDWPVGNKCFVAAGTDLHEGSITEVLEAEIGAPAFTGTGNNDIHIVGNYNGSWEDTLRIKIDAGDATNPNTFAWSIDGGSTWEATGVACVLEASKVALTDGIYVYWDAVTGHNTNDYWDSAVNPFVVELESLTNDSTVYSSGSRLSTALPIQNLTQAVWDTTNAVSGAGETYENRIYLDDPGTAGFQIADMVYIVDVTDTDVSEYRTVDYVGATYIRVTADLDNAYPSGSLVTVRGSGEAAFWVRGDVQVGTAEELKQARLNVRV